MQMSTAVAINNGNTTQDRTTNVVVTEDILGFGKIFGSIKPINIRKEISRLTDKLSQLKQERINWINHRDRWQKEKTERNIQAQLTATRKGGSFLFSIHAQDRINEAVNEINKAIAKITQINNNIKVTEKQINLFKQQIASPPPAQQTQTRLKPIAIGSSAPPPSAPASDNQNKEVLDAMRAMQEQMKAMQEANEQKEKSLLELSSQLQKQQNKPEKQQQEPPFEWVIRDKPETPPANTEIQVQNATPPTTPPITGINGEQVVINDTKPDLSNKDVGKDEPTNAEKRKKIILFSSIAVGAILLTFILFKLFKRKK